MNLGELLAELSERGVKLSVDGEQLCIQAPKGSLTPDLRNALATHKPEIIQLLHRSQIGSTSLPLVPVAQKQNLPVSFQQERLWTLAQVAPVASAHNIAQAIRLSGNLNFNCLQTSINEIVCRHDALRTTFGVMDGNPVQHIAAPELITLSVLSLEALDPTEQIATFWKLADEMAKFPFDLANGPLWQVKLIRLHSQEHILVFAIHHIISDMMSVGLWIRELALLYSAFVQAQPSPLPALPVQYGDFAVWQRQWLNDTVLKPELDYWKQQLQGASFDLKLPIDRPRPLLQNFQAQRQFFHFDADLWQAIKQRSQMQPGITLFMVFVAAFKVLLYLCSHQDNILIGFTTSGRVHPAVESMIGFFGYPLLLRTDLSGNPTFSEVLDRVRSVVLSAYAHQNVPFGKLVEVMGSSRVAPGSSFFQTFRTGLTYVNNQLPTDLTELPDLTLTPVEDGMWGPTDLDLYLYIHEIGTDIQIGIAYNTDIFEAETITDLGQAFFQILAQWAQSADIALNQFQLPERLEAKAQLARQDGLQPWAIAATFTADPMATPLNFWIQQLNLSAKIVFAPYNQIFQQLLTPNSLLATNQTGINIILVRLEDWGKSDSTLAESDQPSSPQLSIERNANDLILALRQATERTPIPHLLCLLPNRPTTLQNPDLAEFLHQIETTFVQELTDCQSVNVITSWELATTYPVSAFYDAHADELGHIPYTSAFFTALATLLSRKIHGLQRSPHKVIVLDCDYTLWQGLCSEDGVDEIVIDSSYQALQAFMVQQGEQGKLLCLCSKNDEADVWAVFEQRSEMVLKRQHLVDWQINWLSKSENLKSLAHSLGLGLESFIFMDDSPVECAEVQQHCPDVLTLQIPTDPTQISAFLRHIWAFDQQQTTAEDHQRTIFYQQNLQRQQVARQSLTLQDFLNSLDLQVEITPMQSSQADRVAQLTQRTNQFNTTTLRRTTAEIQALCPLHSDTCYVVDVKDRFGQYGLVGVMIVRDKPATLVVDIFLLSCRVLGRGVEYQMLNFLGSLALARGLEWVEMIYNQSAKNQPVGAFLEQVGAISKEPISGGYSLRFKADTCRTIALKDDSNPPLQKPDSAVALPSNAVQINGEKSQILSNNLAPYQAIATDWQTPEQILQWLETNSVQGSERSSTLVAPRTQMEKQLVHLWETLLRQSPISIHDHFFDVGGNSLLAVQLLSRLREQFKVTVPIYQLLETPTVAGIAQVIEAAGLAQPTATPPRNSEINLTTDAILDAAIYPSQPHEVVPRQQITHPKAIFLTGATGFLGAYLVNELLRQTQANLYCLVRAADAEQGMQRLHRNLHTYHLWSDSFQSRIVPVIGDLAEAQLGLSDAAFQHLSHHIDVIYHNGALVNFIYPYSALKAANVLGTQEVLRLATLTRLKPVHFVSTLAVFASDAYIDTCVQESDPLESYQGLQGGYLQTKWVAEQLIIQARDRGIPICIYRPGAITGDSQTGIANVNDFFSRMLKGCLQLGKAPTLELPLDLTPVDYGSQAIVQLSQNPALVGKSFHLVSSRSMTWSQLFNLIDDLGYPLKRVPYSQWRAELLHQATTSSENAMHPLLPLLDEDLPLKEMRLPSFNCHNALTGLANTPIICPDVDSAILKTYISYLKTSGFF